MIGHGSKKGLTVKKIAAAKETVKAQAAAAKLAGLKLLNALRHVRYAERISEPVTATA